MNRALVDRCSSLIPEEYKHSFIAQQLASNPQLTFLQVYEWFYDQYRLATEEETTKTTAKLLDNWSPHKGMEKLINRFDKGATYTAFASQEIANHIIVTYIFSDGYQKEWEIPTRI